LKTFLKARDKEEIIARLNSVRPDSLRRWGKMSAHQMICHLGDGFRLYMGLIATAPPGFPYPSRVLKLASLWVPVPWPKGFKTMPEIDQEKCGTPSSEFQRDVEELRSLVDRFTRSPPDFQWPSHPYLGRMSEREWMRLGYLHSDHHLRQFGA
jgi:hypothetical protein